MVATATSAAPQRRYYLRFGASKLEADLEGNFLTRGGTLGGAAARGETDFALTYADHSTPHLLTERHELVQIPLSDTLVQASQALFAEETGGAQFEVNGDVPVLLLSDRTQLLLTSLRTGASINGTLVYSMSGTASVPLHSLFATVDASALVKSSGCNVEQMLGVTTPPFAQIPIKYPNWDAINATIGVNAPVVFTMDENCVEIPVNVAFFTPGKLAARMQAVEPVLKSVYDVSWKKTETVPFAPSAALTKSVTRKAYGFNGSQLQPGLRGQRHAAERARRDARVGHGRGARVRVPGRAQPQPVALRPGTPSFAKAVEHSKQVATRSVALAAFTMPYRVDGTPVINPGGVSMVQAESWPTEPVRVFGATADDCDGSAGCQISLVRFATNLNADPNVDMSRFPNLRAVANSLGAHYVYGTAVLAANAGHAAAANEAATTVAGHAIALAIPKTSILAALERGALSTVAGEPVVESAFAHAVTAARFNALYPRDLVAQMPEEEQKCFQTHQSMVTSNVSHPVTSLQPLAGEGTTFAKSTLYTHDPNVRAELKEFFMRDKEVSESLSPNITRTAKSLDVGANGAHSFYSAFVELGLSLDSPLFTDPALRKLGHATPHLRFAKMSDADAISEAGASPKDLATHAYRVVPLWTAATPEAALIDEAHAESMANTMPARNTAMVLSDDAAKDLSASLDSLRDLNDFLHAPDKDDVALHETAHVIAFAALLNNQKAIESFCDLIKKNRNTRGEVYGLDHNVSGLAVAASDPTRELGRFVTLELMVAL